MSRITSTTTRLTGLAAVAISATVVATTAGPAAAGNDLGETSLVEVLDADGNTFDTNWNDFDIVHRAATTVLAAKPTSAVREFVAQHGIDYRVALDASGDARTLYGGWGLPVHYFLDGGGVIRDRAIGQLTRTAMESRLRSILGG